MDSRTFTNVLWVQERSQILWVQERSQILWVQERSQILWVQERSQISYAMVHLSWRTVVCISVVYLRDLFIMKPTTIWKHKFIDLLTGFQENHYIQNALLRVIKIGKNTEIDYQNTSILWQITSDLSPDFLFMHLLITLRNFLSFSTAKLELYLTSGVKCELEFLKNLF